MTGRKPKSDRVNAAALAIEQALPYSTSAKTGWVEVTPERKRMVLRAARKAIAIDALSPPRKRAGKGRQ